MKGEKVMFIEYNANPLGKQVGDCVIRAISKATNQDWATTYLGIVMQGYILCDMPSANNVWGAYLKQKGFVRHMIPDTCPDCYTVKDFCEEHPKGIFLLALSKHVVVIIDGNHYDSWDSGNESPIYYFERNEE